MFNLEDHFNEVRGIESELFTAHESTLRENRKHLRKILGNRLGISWHGNEYAVRKDITEIDEDLVPVRMSMEEIGQNDDMSLSKAELQNEIQKMIDAFYDLHQRDLFETEDHEIFEEQIVEDAEEIIR